MLIQIGIIVMCDYEGYMYQNYMVTSSLFMQNISIIYHRTVFLYHLVQKMMLGAYNDEEHKLPVSKQIHNDI